MNDVPEQLWHDLTSRHEGEWEIEVTVPKPQLEQIVTRLDNAEAENDSLRDAVCKADYLERQLDAYENKLDTHEKRLFYYEEILGSVQKSIKQSIQFVALSGGSHLNPTYKDSQLFKALECLINLQRLIDGTGVDDNQAPF